MEPVLNLMDNYSPQELETIFEKLWNIYPDGNKSMTFSRFKQSIEEDKITPEDILTAYRKFYTVKSKCQNGNYTKKEDKIVRIYDFINTGMFKNSYAAAPTKNIQRDFYIYGKR